MAYLPFYLGGVSLLILVAIGALWLQNERYKKALMERTRQALELGTPEEHIFAQLVHEGFPSESAVGLLQQARSQIFASNALRRLLQGDSETAVTAYLTEMGAAEETIQGAIAKAGFIRSVRRRPILTLSLGILRPLLGTAVVVGGLGLWYGNKSGLFVTFPYAGHFVIGVGATMFWGGGKIVLTTLRAGKDIEAG